MIPLSNGDFAICCNKESIWPILLINSVTFSSKVETFSQIDFANCFNFWSFAQVKLAIFLINLCMSFF